MPTRPPRACPSCGALIYGALHGCPPRSFARQASRLAHDYTRGSAQSRGYTKRWARYAQGFRARLPFCGMQADGSFSAEHSQCVKQGNLRSLGECVDHIIPARDGGSFWDPRNHQTLCSRCNTIKG